VSCGGLLRELHCERLSASSPDAASAPPATALPGGADGAMALPERKSVVRYRIRDISEWVEVKL